MLEHLALSLAGLAGLFYGGKWLVRSASGLALSYGVSALVIGLTVVALGTSMPELLVSAQAALAGKSDLAIGNVIGSNIANIGLILGATGLIAPLTVRAGLLRREIPIMIVCTVFVFLLTLDGKLDAVDGVILLLAFVAFNAMFYRLAKRERRARELLLGELEEQDGSAERLAQIAWLLLGIAALALGAKLMIDGAVGVARMMGLSELVIAISLVAFGTSLPELAASLSAAWQGETDLAIGNVVGSNIANLLLILGVTAILQPIPIQEGGLRLEFGVMLAFAALLIPFSHKRRLGRLAATLFLGAYVAFIAFSVVVGRAAIVPG